MRNKWISSLLVGCILLGTVAGPVSAALCPGDFLPWVSAVIEEPQNRLVTSREYVVREGDTLWGLSREYHVDLETFLLMNNLDEDTLLTIGKTLKIPVSTCTVKKGDTIFSLADRYQVSVEDLMMANHNIDPEQLAVGEVLIIPVRENETVAMANSPSRGLIQAVVLGWPLVGRITSEYGWRKSGYHHGIDIAKEIGTPIKAADDGTVVFSGTKSVYGKTVVIRHSDGKETLYAHAQSILVSKNQKVRKGQTIALVGVTGRTTGPHLHFEVKINGKTIDPMKYLQ